MNEVKMISALGDYHGVAIDCVSRSLSYEDFLKYAVILHDYTETKFNISEDRYLKIKCIFNKAMKRDIGGYDA